MKNPDYDSRELSFYSILVRLKGFEEMGRFPVYSEFLFHIGSIKRIIRRFFFMGMNCFYSILVRLKDC